MVQYNAIAGGSKIAASRRLIVESHISRCCQFRVFRFRNENDVCSVALTPILPVIAKKYFEISLLFIYHDIGFQTSCHLDLNGNSASVGDADGDILSAIL